MPITRDFKAYHESIATEMRSLKDRVRNLIGPRHWQSDGEHKEAVLRKVLRNHVAQTLHIGRGFVCARNTTSTQQDILIVHRDKPTLFRDGEMLLVTPDSVAALVEVKTRIRSQADLNRMMEGLANQAAMIRDAGNERCVAGLFVYDHDVDNADCLLQSVHNASRGDARRVINWVAAGPNLFIRHWARGEDVSSPIEGQVWHSYTLQNLAHAYFVSNVVWDTCPNLDRQMQYAWFPVEGGKERHRQWYIGLDDDEPRRFNQ